MCKGYELLAVLKKSDKSNYAANKYAGSKRRNSSYSLGLCSQLEYKGRTRLYARSPIMRAHIHLSFWVKIKPTNPARNLTNTRLIKGQKLGLRHPINIF